MCAARPCHMLRFVDPNRDTVIAPVTAPEEAAHYPPVTCGAYVQARFDAAFAYRKKTEPHEG